MRPFTKRRGVALAAVIAALAMMAPAMASPIPAHQTPERHNTPLDHPDRQKCVVEHWHGWGYCEVAHPDLRPSMVGGLTSIAQVKAIPDEDGWKAEGQFWAVDLDTGEVVRYQSASKTEPLDWTPNAIPHDPADPVGAAEHIATFAVAGHHLPTATLAAAPGSTRFDGPTRVGCLVRGVNTTGNLECMLRN